jgi:hypothetical protein
MLHLRQAELQQRMVQEQAQLTRVEARLKQIEMENTMPDYFDKAHHAALKWIEANGYKVVGPNREVYLYNTNPVRQDDPSYVTEVQFPVAKV